MVNEIDKHTFVEQVKGISIVDFFTPDCPTCSKLGAVFEAVAEQKTEINFFKVDLDEDITLAEKFSIDHIPTLILFRDSEPIKTVVGFLDEVQLAEFIDSISEANL